ncbi:unnamed protein product [Caenorhabditis bovis]|uniref:Uncharacterized protein n=1 Tax=Caenorhabditis bovis TaxID=2654633 RepID=A0A8S1EIR5_9PELO|nr:unnamed protein product [Caenorhabditis bovis]
MARSYRLPKTKYSEIPDCTIDREVTRNRAKILVSGCQGVGKSAFIHRLHDNVFVEEQSADKLLKIVTRAVNGEIIRAELEEVDLEEFTNIPDESAADIHHKRDWIDVNWVFLLYSTADRSSFNEIKKQLPVIQRRVAPNCFISLVGTKADIKNREISWEEGEEYSKEVALSLFEISTKTGINCELVLAETLDALEERRYDEIASREDVQQEQPMYQDTVEPGEEAHENGIHLNLFCWVPKIPFTSIFSR